MRGHLLFMLALIAIWLTTVTHSALALPVQHIEPRGGSVSIQNARDSCTKRGLGWGFDDPRQLLALKGITWSYNWGLRPSAGAANASRQLGLEFVPMQWGRWGAESLAADQLPPSSQTILGFNEPNHPGGITPTEAAQLWPHIQKVADELGLRLGSPAAAPCGGPTCVEPDPFKWWDEFFYRCKGCRVEFIATHYYACNVDWLAAYLAQCRKYGLPIWLTEFACPNPTGPPMATWRYMWQALELLDADPSIERYAWFAVSTQEWPWLGPSNSLLNLTTLQPTRLGHIYLNCEPPARAQGSGQRREAPSPMGGAAGAARAGGGGLPGGQRGAAGGEELPAAAEPWSSLCRECLAAVQGGGLRGVGAAQRRRCGERCGLWDRGA